MGDLTSPPMTLAPQHMGGARKGSHGHGQAMSTGTALGPYCVVYRNSSIAYNMYRSGSQGLPGGVERALMTDYVPSGSLTGLPSRTSVKLQQTFEKYEDAVKLFNQQRGRAHAYAICNGKGEIMQTDDHASAPSEEECRAVIRDSYPRGSKRHEHLTKSPTGQAREKHATYQPAAKKSVLEHLTELNDPAPVHQPESSAVREQVRRIFSSH